MAKDAFYFSHDSNAWIDPKSIKLRRIAGLAGYGLFWCVIEMLRDASEYRLPISMLEDIAYELRADPKLFDSIFECDLLKKDETHFWSDSLIDRMRVFEEMREQRREAGKISAQKRKNERPMNDRSTTDERENERPMNDRSTTDEHKRVKESKVKESKEKEIKEEEPAKLPAILDTENFRLVWSEWIAFRKEKKKPVTPISQKKALEALQEIGEEAAIETINRSIRNGWQGLFPEKNGGNKQTPQGNFDAMEFLKNY